MCLILFAVNEHPQYKLIVAANRDEFYARKTAPARFWIDHADILGGRDLEANGTWMGITKKGRISMVTNYRDLKNIQTGAPSRGSLVADYLEGHGAADDYIKNVEAKRKSYNGFNLLIGSPDELWYCSNYHEGSQKITEGVHGLSNHLLDTDWSKVKRGKEQLEILLRKANVKPVDFFNILYNNDLAKDNELPDTGVGLELERALSAMFIKSQGYGSRCSTVVMVDKNNTVTFVERTYNPTQNFQFVTRSYEFVIESEL